ncbi:unnamed protein product [Rotaria sordida]|uniref:Uncharacterized protein n=2 Tax=Rotaria sordida TaxID=392033 RepID=A0A818K7M6_9BILA|nr:unnamed protein product [Rotaria sordida]CAF3516648.1 unnamed protein product [Rotaria sordida]CAF3555166.1 unnamed protein product [Rotaria sordida]
MSTISLASWPFTSISITNNDQLIKSTNSSQTLDFEEHDTSQSSTQTNQTLSDTNSALTDSSLSDDSDSDNGTSISSRENLNSNLSNTKIVTNLKLEDNEAEFFTIIPSQNTTMININNKNKNNHMTITKKKHHKIRSAFKNKFHRSDKCTLNNNNNNTDNWNEVLGTTLLQITQDMNSIVFGFDQTNEQIFDDSLSNISENVQTTSHQSFCEDEQAKIQMMKMAHLLDQSRVLINDKKKFPYPYADIIQGNNINSRHHKQQVPSENFLIQHKPFRHRRPPYRIQRRLLKIQHDLDKLKDHRSSKNSTKSYENLSSLNIENYQSRLTKNLLKVRKEIAEYHLLNLSTDDHKENSDQTIENVNTDNSTTKSQIEDYQKNLKLIENIKKQRKHLISAPFIPHEARYIHEDIKKDINNNNYPIDSRFDPTISIDLCKEAEDFFGSDRPFWNPLPILKSSLSLQYLKRQSNDLVLPAKIIISVNLISEDTIKENDLDDVEFDEIENYINDLYKQSQKGNDEFFDCISSPSERKKSQSLSFSNNQQLSISFNECESVEF